MKRFRASISGAFVALAVCASLGSTEQNPLHPAVPVDPIAAIFDAFRSHSVVAVPNDHGNAVVLAFDIALIRDPRLAANVNDIVLEGGNARYQGLVDRYIRGEDVPASALAPIFEESTQWQLGGNVGRGRRTGRDLYQTIREVNARLPANRKLRVLLADPPIDWTKVHTKQDYQDWLAMRDSYPASLIQLEVLAKGRHVLVMFGQMHLQRRQVVANYDMSSWQAQTLVSILERTTPTRVFSVWWVGKTPPAPAASWPVPSLALLRGTDIGARDFDEARSGPRVRVEDNRFVPIPRNEWQVLPIEEQFDAVLYLGNPTDPPLPTPEPSCADQAYLKERLRRLELATAPPAEVDRLRQLCASRPQK